MNYWTFNKKNIWVAAHRGWSKKYPENTLLAFKEAIALGVDQLETDVHMTKDGELVLIHDKTVDRTTNGTGAVKDMTLEQLKALDAGGWKGPICSMKMMCGATESLRMRWPTAPGLWMCTPPAAFWIRINCPAPSIILRGIIPFPTAAIIPKMWII